MALTPYTGTIHSISGLPDEPTISAAELKGKFDSDAAALAGWINSVLVSYVNGLTASLIGFVSTASVPASTVQEAIAYLAETQGLAVEGHSLAYNAAPTVEVVQQEDGSRKLVFGIPMGTPTVADDMAVSVYDTRGKAEDIFAYADSLKTKEYTVTLPAAGWTDSAVSAGQLVVANAHILTSGEIFDLFPAMDNTDSQDEAWNAANPRVVSVAAGSFTLAARGVRPLVDIPCILRIYK